jgi:predicted RecB family endonuclease
MSKIIDKAYESIRGYVPEDVNRVLAEQIPKIEQYIEEEVDAFGEELSNFIEGAVDQAVADVTAEAEQVKQNLLSAIAEIEADMSDNDATLRMATSQLKTAVDEYEAKFAKLGMAVQKGVKAAIKTTGLPL